MKHEARNTILVLLVLFLTGCLFKKGNLEGTIGYRDGYVFLTKEKWYKVGVLPEGWRKLKSRAKAESFFNPKYQATVSTTAYCEDGVKNRSPELMTGELLMDLKDRVTLEEKKIKLDGREGFFAKAKGRLNSNNIFLCAMAVKDDNCAFNFIFVSEQEFDQNAFADFESFYGGFKY